jgi:HK97 family phage prohead protease
MPNLIERRNLVHLPATATEQRLADGSSAAPEVEAPLLSLRADGSTGLPAIVGYSAVFGVDTEINSWFGKFKERIQQGAFKRAIREAQDVRALRNHDPDNLLGRTAAKTLTLREDNIGLFIEVDTPDTTIGRDTAESIRRGDISGMSFAFIVRKEKWINGEDGTPDMRVIQDVDLFDVGPVTYPAYTQTSASLRDASAVHRSGLRELGKEVPVLRAEQQAELDGEVKGEPAPVDEVKAEEEPPVVDADKDYVQEGIAVEEAFSAPSVPAAVRAKLELVRAQRAENEYQLSRLTK